MHVSPHTDHRAGERLTKVGASLNRLVERHLATNRIKTGPEGACERFIHYYGRAGGEIGLGEVASRTDRDAHRAEIARGDGHKPHLWIVQGVRGAPRALDGRRYSHGGEGRGVGVFETTPDRQTQDRVMH